VTEYRNLVQRDKVDVVLGYVSSGIGLAIVRWRRAAQLTVLDVCGTPRIFEEKRAKYVFRINPHATMET